jgi:hypothetical protein
MAAQLNIFKTITANVTTSSTAVYTAPAGYATVVLLAQVANVSGNVITVGSHHVRSGIPTALVEGAGIPPNDALNLITGRLILQTGDSLTVRASSSGSGQLLLSILETAT